MKKVRVKWLIGKWITENNDKDEIYNGFIVNRYIKINEIEACCLRKQNSLFCSFVFLPFYCGFLSIYWKDKELSLTQFLDFIEIHSPLYVSNFYFLPLTAVCE